MDTHTKLQQAISQAQAGNRAATRQLLVELVKAEPHNEMAWLWLETTLEDARQKRECLEIILKLNPANTVAQSRLKELVSPAAVDNQDSPEPARVAPAVRLKYNWGQGTSAGPSQIMMVIVIFASFFIYMITMKAFGDEPTPVRSPYTVSADSTQFRLLWTAEGVAPSGYASYSTSMLAAGENDLFFLGAPAPAQPDGFVTRFDLLTGQPEATFEVAFQADSLAIAAQTLYVEVSGNRSQAAVVATYHGQSGQQLSYTRYRDRVEAIPENVAADEVAIGPGPWGRLPFAENGLLIGPNYARSQATNDFLWWRRDLDYRGRFAVSNGILFVFTGQTDLAAVRASDGKTLATLRFDPSAPPQEIARDTRVYQYSVAARNNLVAVYLGDSQQLFVFRFIRPQGF
jgi:hypothetical protein